MSGPTGEPVLALRDAHYAYPGGAVALAGASLTVHARESVAILGANGCGKSTLLMVLAGLCHPNPGSLTAFGEPVTEERLRDDGTAWRFRRRVGIVFQNADAQLFCSTVRDELAFGPLQLGLPADEVEGRTRDIASMLRLGPLLDRPPFRLSGGEKRKVALASVLAVNPRVILLDEPTTGLDPRTQQWLIETLQTLQAAGKTLVTATHDLEVVPNIAQRAVVMNEAHAIETEGDPCSVLADRDLLLRVNLIHEHSHYHGVALHSHPHTHSRDHQHDH